MDTLRAHVKFNDGLCLRRPQDNIHAGEWFPGVAWNQRVHWGSAKPGSASRTFRDGRGAASTVSV